MNYKELDTPALIIDKARMLNNIQYMQEYADKNNVFLRPHTKTHKMPELAKLQEKAGCKGITVAKVGEAEIMANQGLSDIFIANEIVGQQKLERIRALSHRIAVSFAVDTPSQILAANSVFASEEAPIDLLIEIEVGENRSGIIEDKDFLTLLHMFNSCPHVRFKGVFSHEGHCYNAKSIEDCHKKFIESQQRTLHYAELAKEFGLPCEVVSIGSTPSLMQGFNIEKGITEIRPGTYILMDASMASTIGNLDRCAATILTTIISRPTDERVIADVGAKGITAQRRTEGISATPGLGTLKSMPDIHVFDVFDEHAIFMSKKLHDHAEVGDKVEIIPVHICPVCNLYETAYLVEDNEVIKQIPILCRGKLQ